MKIKEILQITSPRETAGPRTFNAYQYQISMAAFLVLELMKTSSNFVALMDYLDDIIILDDEKNPTQITFYQVKTSERNRITLTTILTEDWLKHMNENIEGFTFVDSRAFLVTNAEIKLGVKGSKVKNEVLFKMFNTPEKLSDLLRKSPDQEYIITEILDKLNVDREHINFDKIMFLRSTLPISGHDDYIYGLLSQLIYTINSKLDAASIHAIYNEFRRKLENFSKIVYQPSTILFEELIVTKGFVRNDFDYIIKKASDALLPLDFNSIYRFAIDTLEYKFGDKNFMELSRDYRTFNLSVVENHETYNHIVNFIKKIDIKDVQNKDLICKIKEMIEREFDGKELGLYKDFSDFITIVYLYKNGE